MNFLFNYRSVLKPFLDVMTALVILILSLPVWVIIILLLLLFHQGKILFKQSRPGLNGKLFDILKFSTMNERKGPDGNLLPDHLRLTGLGRFLRKTSLDELPQLFNVLKGEMSIVGPRPLLTEYLGLYSSEQARRHDVRPGITGWAQVNGRNAIRWKDKLAMDVWYVDHQSFLLDLKILLLTLGRVVQAKGINAPGSATTEKFNGNN